MNTSHESTITEWWHNYNKIKYDKTVWIFYGIYCVWYRRRKYPGPTIYHESFQSVENKMILWLNDTIFVETEPKILFLLFSSIEFHFFWIIWSLILICFSVIVSTCSTSPQTTLHHLDYIPGIEWLSVACYHDSDTTLTWHFQVQILEW